LGIRYGRDAVHVIDVRTEAGIVEVPVVFCRGELAAAGREEILEIPDSGVAADASVGRDAASLR